MKMESEKILNKHNTIWFLKTILILIGTYLFISKVLDTFQVYILSNYIKNPLYILFINLGIGFFLIWLLYWKIFPFISSFWDRDYLKKQLLKDEKTEFFREWYAIDPVGFDGMIERYKLSLNEICTLPKKSRVRKHLDFFGKELVPYVERTTDEIIYQNAKLDLEINQLLYNQRPVFLLKNIYPEYFGELELNIIHKKTAEILEDYCIKHFKSVNNEKVNFDLQFGIECLEKHKNEFLKSNQDFKNALEKVSSELNEQEKLILAKGYLDLTIYYNSLPFKEVVLIFRSIYMTEKGIR